MIKTLFLLFAASLPFLQSAEIDNIVVYKTFSRQGTTNAILSELKHPFDSTNINVNQSIIRKEFIDQVLRGKGKRRMQSKIPGLGYGGNYTRTGADTKFYFFIIERTNELYTSETGRYYNIPQELALKKRIE